MLRPLVRALEIMLIGGAATCAGCVSLDAISPEQAAVERAAIERDLAPSYATLCQVASVRSTIQHPELHGRRIACAISDAKVTFKSDVRANYTISYVCGIAPWQPKRTAPAATPSIALELLKEHGAWGINAFL